MFFYILSLRMIILKQIDSRRLNGPKSLLVLSCVVFVALFPCSSISLIEFSAGVQGIITLFQGFLFLLVSLKFKRWAQKYCTIGLIEF